MSSCPCGAPPSSLNHIYSLTCCNDLSRNQGKAGINIKIKPLKKKTQKECRGKCVAPAPPRSQFLFPCWMLLLCWGMLAELADAAVMLWCSDSRDHPLGEPRAFCLTEWYPCLHSPQTAHTHKPAHIHQCLPKPSPAADFCLSPRLPPPHPPHTHTHTLWAANILAASFSFVLRKWQAGWVCWCGCVCVSVWVCGFWLFEETVEEHLHCATAVYASPWYGPVVES